MPEKQYTESRFNHLLSVIMPSADRYHSVVLRCLEKAGWTIIKEQEYISIGTHNDTNRRLYVDIKAQRHDQQLVLIEVKGLERSPVHELMGLLGQYLIYKLALDYLTSGASWKKSWDQAILSCQTAEKA